MSSEHTFNYGNVLNGVLNEISKSIGMDGGEKKNLGDSAFEVAKFLVGGKEEKMVLLYGKVQSGKTNATISTIAACIDEGLRLFILLTSDNTSLYNQTIDRVRKTLIEIKVVGHKEIDRSINAEEVKESLSSNGIVIVCTKNTSVLNKLINFVAQLNAFALPITATIFDDEADFGSLNSKINRNKQSEIFKKVNRLFDMFERRNMVLVTATPEAIFLQNQSSGRKVEKIIQIPYGKGYTGGEQYFDRELQETRNRQREIPEEEITSFIKLVKEDHEKGKGFNIESLNDAICDFLVGASLKSIEKQNKKYFSMVVHISSKIRVNDALVEKVKEIFHEIEMKLSNGEANLQSKLRKVFDDFSRGMPGSNIQFDEVLEKIRRNINAKNVEKITTGRGRDEPHYDRLYNVIVGGDRIGRGLTIDNLITFYYGRASGAPKVDTMLQHARLYGYRKDLLDVNRVYLTQDLFGIYEDVYGSEKEQWDYYKKNSDASKQPVILRLHNSSNLRSTRREVIPAQSLLKYFPGMSYIMKGANGEHTKEINELLSKWVVTKSKEPAEVDFELIKKCLEYCKSDNTTQRWNTPAILEAIKYRVDNGLKSYLVVRTDRDLKKDYRSALGPEENSIKKSDGVILFMLRTEGSEEKGWDGTPAWIPVVRFPDDDVVSYFTTDETYREDMSVEKGS